MEQTLKLGVIVASTRPVRVGLPVGRWFFDVVQRHGKFDATWIDLAEVNLPFLDEPKHPRFKEYQHEHTKRWSAMIDAMDAYVFVTPEYDYGPPASLINALQFLYKEWGYKAAAFVSYGGVSGGTRSVNGLRIVLSALQMVPLASAVHIPFVTKLVEEGVFHPTEGLEGSAIGVLDELLKWSTAVRGLRG